MSSDVFAVVGATRGTGLHIATQLLKRGKKVRVIARDATKAKSLLGTKAEVIAGDVTIRESLGTALKQDCQAIFYAVDMSSGITGRGFLSSAAEIRNVTYQGFVNVVNEARANDFNGRIILLSGMGCDRCSTLGVLLNTIKGNLQKNMVDREQFLKESGLDYTVCRGAVLNNNPGNAQRIVVKAPENTLSLMRQITRADFARVLIAAAERPIASRKTYDVFNEPGPPNDEEDIEFQFQNIP
ncbi:hypothetical protein B488_08060 [Liberibacter crescens BT-1]|uniref:NAD(P)-binding domain-containing protein n=1 Tax=Liberibacter crescens (strain BT-1) TaxID=1215343 RepID=L0EVU7_LIBCB|nr:SDR family NAD(P)-dependent oxidoreductase [Liberibacter crescens]AGA64798.1 hypothetical protein B488_08060 [Liberibacter crescens BT-1]AMC12860.1 hypothetical protein RL73_04070 [Liberibacter crescens]